MTKSLDIVEGKLKYVARVLSSQLPNVLIFSEVSVLALNRENVISIRFNYSEICFCVHFLFINVLSEVIFETVDDIKFLYNGFITYKQRFTKKTYEALVKGNK